MVFPPFFLCIHFVPFIFSMPCAQLLSSIFVPEICTSISTNRYINILLFLISPAFVFCGCDLSETKRTSPSESRLSTRGTSSSVHELCAIDLLQFLCCFLLCADADITCHCCVSILFCCVPILFYSVFVLSNCAGFFIFVILCRLW